MRIPHARGQSFLATVLVIGAIIATVGVTLLFLANAFLGIGYGYRASVSSSAVAVSGAEDALLKLDRDPGMSNTSYNISVGGQTAAVTITAGSPSSGEDTVVSTATVLGSRSAVTVVVGVNLETDKVWIISWQATP